MDKDAGCIREISRRVRLSKSTVAKALHNCGNVDVGTKEAILRAAREVQYDPAGARRAKIQAGETVVALSCPSTRTHSGTRPSAASRTPWPP